MPKGTDTRGSSLRSATSLMADRSSGKYYFLLLAILCFGQLSPVVAAEKWMGLRIAGENRCTAYDRQKHYKYSQRVEDKIIERLGAIFSPYTGKFFQSKKETDIEHIVATSEAHDSGLCSQPAATKKRFASDLRNLTLASPGCNRHKKKAKDAAEWLPPHNKCWFVDRVIEVKQAYGLTVDRAEARALQKVLEKCESTDMYMPEKIRLCQNQ